MNQADYARVERAIRFLDAHYLEQPGLDEVARASGLSPFHLQRMFRRWAGISPKRFLQFLTAEHARALLEASRTTLDTACDAGLSSVSRLHELTVAVHAATPGEIQARGRGLEIIHGTHETRFGKCFVGATARGICWLSFSAVEEALAEMQRRWPWARLRHSQAETRVLVRPLVEGKGSAGVHLFGTNFQIRVWEALLRIPGGRVVCYEDLAMQVCSPLATRAVASAVAGNPVAFLIPCHRVIRKTGVFGQYRWGSERKKAMLVWESLGAPV
ncbi:MAG: methylated-DNA--[protein]-cysteine S-methyltransferase [Acidobacteriia bacterium]|nr:methylated-DNA--[protein]-cysteine S-methyltransferase [Terriglobia bacterium]